MKLLETVKNGRSNAKLVKAEEHLHKVAGNHHKISISCKVVTFLDTVNYSTEVNYEMVSLPHEEFIAAATFVGAPKVG
jgi:hypothetical protein